MNQKQQHCVRLLNLSSHLLLPVKQLTHWLSELDIRCDAEEVNTLSIILADDQALTEAQIAALPDQVQIQGSPAILINTGELPLPFHKVWTLLGMGFKNILTWQLQSKLAQLILSHLNRWQIINKILKSKQVQDHLIGSSPIWQKILHQVIEMACFSNAPLLIMGESGTGKEGVAKLVHTLDRRSDKEELVILDCSTLVPELSGSEFFGHEKGSFTNAISMREGAFGLANRGTLFLDEVGELPLQLQAPLLRVIQEGSYKRVGSNTWRETNFRLVAATNRKLSSDIEKGLFRQDLFYRISACILQLPPLSARKADIIELACHFLKKELKTTLPPAFDDHMTHYLLSRHYPGNIRELHQLIRRIAYKYTGEGPITLGCLPEADRDTTWCPQHAWQKNSLSEAIRHALADNIGLKEIKRIAGDIAIEIAIDQTNGNLQEAAKRLNVTDRLIQGWCKENGR
ncbi:MAG: sigma 54-interacting transcriptional regulator [Saprospiraceae bacterium]